MICFHFTIFVVLETTGFGSAESQWELWFAFILLSLSYWKQHPGGDCWLEYVVICFHFTIFVVLETTHIVSFLDAKGCDLLSFYYLCRTGNNKNPVSYRSGAVVICFHFTIFVVLETTRKNGCAIYRVLWFAFILLSLSYWKQPRWKANAVRLVVICFHFTIFVVLETTPYRRLDLFPLLWFAFILLSLSYWKQLSPYYACETTVVICFHFTIFVVLETTRKNHSIHEHGLWFAFILLSLSYWKQQDWRIPPGADSCDLLSFYYLCRTGNNRIYIIRCISARYKDNWNTKNVVSDRM